MASGIERSHRKIEFARRILPDGDYMRGPYRSRESPVDVFLLKSMTIDLIRGFCLH